MANCDGIKVNKSLEIIGWYEDLAKDLALQCAVIIGMIGEGYSDVEIIAEVNNIMARLYNLKDTNESLRETLEDDGSGFAFQEAERLCRAKVLRACDGDQNLADLVTEDVWAKWPESEDYIELEVARHRKEVERVKALYSEAANS